MKEKAARDLSRAAFTCSHANGATSPYTLLLYATKPKTDKEVSQIPPSQAGRGPLISRAESPLTLLRPNHRQPHSQLVERQ